MASATPVGAVGIGAPTCECSRPINSDVGVFEVAPEDLPSVVKLVAGWMPDQSDPHQVLASSSLRDAGVHVGTVIHVPLYAASQRTALLSGASLKPGGPTVALRVVGIEAADGEFPGTGPPDHHVYTTQAFARTVNRQTVILAAYLVRLRHGAADLQLEAADVEGVPVGLDVRQFGQGLVREPLRLLTVHGAPGFPFRGRRRVLSLRYLSADARHAPRQWRTSPPLDSLESQLPAGAALDHPLFPVVWP